MAPDALSTVLNRGIAGHERKEIMGEQLDMSHVVIQEHPRGSFMDATFNTRNMRKVSLSQAELEDNAPPLQVSNERT